MNFETISSKLIKYIFFGLLRKPFGKSSTGTIVLLCIVLIVITLFVYMQVGNHQFLSFDDPVYVTENSHVVNGISIDNIKWAFTSCDVSNWHPITWISHMVDVELFGMNPRGHHLTNVTIHTISALLVFILFVRMTSALWQSFFVAALFALHPLHVESVAWVAERKDVLSALFWFLTLIFYSEYVAKQKISLYILALCSFVLGLMSKSMLVTLPIVLFLLDFWPLQRFRDGKPGLHQLLFLVKDKIPFLVCSLFSCFITIYAQHKGKSIADLSVVPFLIRIENALVSYATYIGKTIWPSDLAILYPFQLFIPIWQITCALSILTLITTTAVFTWRRYPYFVAGWFWFLITLLPVIGLVQIGTQSMADRYSYISSIGLFTILAWGVTDLTKSWRHQRSALTLLTGAVFVISTILTWRQLGYWRDNITLYRHTLQVTVGNYIIHGNLGRALQTKGDLDAAIAEYQKALHIKFSHASTHINLGTALQVKGLLDAAIQEYQLALRISPDDSNTHCNLGTAFTDKGYMNAAIMEFQRALLINPDNKTAHNNLGVVFARRGELTAAIREYQEALRISPGFIDARNNLMQIISLEQTQNEIRK